WRNGDGILWPSSFRRPTGLLGVRDGTSNTLMVGEDVFGRVPDIGHNWVHSVCSFRMCNAPPNYRRADGTYWGRWFDLGFASYHTGGGQFANGDGSVRFVSDSIPLGTYRALATIRGGEGIREAP